MTQRSVKNNEEITIGCYSCKITETELKYPVGQQELLPAFKGCRIFTTSSIDANSQSVVIT